MADAAWTAEESTAPPKKKVPTWVWFCGGGCLAMIVLAVVAIGLAVSYGRKAADPEVQWPRLAKVLPYDERPEGLELQTGLQMGSMIGMEQYMLRDRRSGIQLQIQYHKGANAGAQRDQLFGSDDPVFPENMVLMKFKDLQTGVVEVQGRELRCLRMRIELAGFMQDIVPEEGQQGLGSMIMIDATREGDEGFLVLQLLRERGSDPITDDEVRQILKPFHVGPNR